MDALETVEVRVLCVVNASEMCDIVKVMFESVCSPFRVVAVRRLLHAADHLLLLYTPHHHINGLIDSRILNWWLKFSKKFSL